MIHIFDHAGNAIRDKEIAAVSMGMQRDISTASAGVKYRSNHLRLKGVYILARVKRNAVYLFNTQKR